MTLKTYERKTPQGHMQLEDRGDGRATLVLLDATRDHQMTARMDRNEAYALSTALYRWCVGQPCPAEEER